MADVYGRKKYRRKNITFTILAMLLICTVFIGVIMRFHSVAEENAYEILHMQTKQIKDDLVLQLKSDRENLVTMANFAAKLYADGEDYDIMFESFKPIGLFSNIGILKPAGMFVTKRGSIDLSGRISFEEEKKLGAYISGRVPDLTRNGGEIIRSAVPITVGRETVGILYGVIHLKTIGEKYNKMAQELNAQLFVYNKATGKFLIDTIGETPGELSELKTRKFNPGYSYKDIISNDSGYSSFKSIFTGEDLYVHYSTLEDFNWGIMLARYESQVFAETHVVFNFMFIVFMALLLIISTYVIIIMQNERNETKVNVEASSIRRLLLEINQQSDNLHKTLKKIQEFSGASAAFFADTDKDDRSFIPNTFDGKRLTDDEWRYFAGELFRYAYGYRKADKSAVSVMHICPDKKLEQENLVLCIFMQERRIKECSFAVVADKNKNTNVLGVINPKRSRLARELLQDVAICFSIAIYNKKYLNRTELAATTDSLTAVRNRAQYKKDILKINQAEPLDFSCIYIDVNELHIRNNKFGHTAGDEMLIYIANTLKTVFFGRDIYRIGGDEFLVFIKGKKPEDVNAEIAIFTEQLKLSGYNVALGMSYRSLCNDCEALVREAELRMYEAKAKYYQNKGPVVEEKVENNYVQMETGIKEIDTMLSVIKEHYGGIYYVSLETDSARCILMPTYLGYNQNEESFSKLFIKYTESIVHPDYHRAMMNFLNYDVMKTQMAAGRIPSIKYEKVTGESVVLSVYDLSNDNDPITNTLWVFSR